MQIKIYYWKNAKYTMRLGKSQEPTPTQILSDYGLVYDHDRIDLPYGDEKICEKIFQEFNVRDMIGQKVARAVGHTSMSVGDIIDLAGDAYIVEPIGFSKIELPIVLKAGIGIKEKVDELKEE
jgi:hypothetical protein